MGTGMKLSLGRAAKAGGASKATLLKALGAGELTGTKGSDGVWAIDSAEVARWRENREKPQRGRRPAPPEAPAPASDNVELAVEREKARQLEERLAETKEALALATARADAAQARADEAWSRVAGLLEGPKGSWWSRLKGGL